MKITKYMPNYLFLGNSSDIDNTGEHFLYRLLEIFPGAFVWGTFLLAIVLSMIVPFWVAVFMLGFALYWLFKVVYLAFHTRSAYRKVKLHQEIDWVKRLDGLSPSEYRVRIAHWRELWQLVILPMHKEPYEVVQPAVEAITKSTWPNDYIIFVLAAEEFAGEEAQKIAARLSGEFGNVFAHFLVTVHPSGIAGEIPGKGSNERWAGLRAKELIDSLGIPYEHVIVSSFDSDTVIYPDYFSCLSYHYLTVENPLRASYQPVPFFINNIWEAPALSRVIAFSSTFWHMMNQERPEKHLTFSSHSMPFTALADIGFWQPNVVSEDSRIFWQCFLYYNGDYRVESLYYPVKMDANVARSFWRTLANLYKQQRRWAYGSADVPYFLFGFWKKRKEISFEKMRQYAFPVIEGFYSWATHAILLFVLGWLPIMLGGDEFNQTLFSYNLPRITRTLLTVAMVGLMSSAFLSMILLPPRPPQYGRWKYALMAAQWILVPITLIIFGSFPAIEAQTRLMLGKYMGFWVTEKHRKERNINHGTYNI